MSDEESEQTHHKASGVPPLAKRTKPVQRSSDRAEPTNQELYRTHLLSQEATVESTEELARRLGQLHEGLQDLDDRLDPDNEDLPPAC